MRKVKLNMNEQERLDVIKKVISGVYSKERAEVMLSRTRRQINRYIIGYMTYGENYFSHKNKERKPSITLSNELCEKIYELYINKYFDSNFTHFSELLLKYESIKVSSNTIKKILFKKKIVSPMAHRKTKKFLKNYSEQLEEDILEYKDALVSDDILKDYEAHPRRPRCKYAGELIQMDASDHLWFGDTKTNLHAAIDDANGYIVGLYFCEQETLDGYYKITEQILKNYGIPVQILTDKRTVFTYKRKESKLSDSAYTQYGYACKQLGIQLDSTSIPQAKGRVERLFRTLQSRLITELKIRNITTINEANAYLKEFITEFNIRFGINDITSCYAEQPTEEKINLIFARIETRKIDNGCCLKYKNKYYRPINENEEYINFGRGTESLIIESYNKTLYAAINEKTYKLVEVDTNRKESPNFEVIVKLPSKKIYIPPMNHPWRLTNWHNYLEYQKQELKFKKSKHKVLV